MSIASGQTYGEMPEQLEHGLRILARIIAREFIKSKTKNGNLNGDHQNSGSTTKQQFRLREIKAPNENSV